MPLLREDIMRLVPASVFATIILTLRYVQSQIGIILANLPIAMTLVRIFRKAA